MAEIARITGLAPPGSPGDLQPVAPVTAITRRPGQDQAAAEDGAAATQSAPPGPNGRTPPAADKTTTDSLEQKLEAILKEVLGDDFSSRRLSIAQDEATGRFVYRVIDVTTGEVIRQYPPDEILKIVAQIQQASGLILDANA